jgi:hypothetical protein
MRFDRVTKTFIDGAVAVDRFSLEVPNSVLTVFSFSDTMFPSGSVIRSDSSLSQALHAALSSESAIGVAVVGTSEVIGGAKATDIPAAARLPSGG